MPNEAPAPRRAWAVSACPCPLIFLYQAPECLGQIRGVGMEEDQKLTQNKSAFSPSLALTISPLAVTTSTSTI